jgi:hypothetical protein
MSGDPMDPFHNIYFNTIFTLSFIFLFSSLLLLYMYACMLMVISHQFVSSPSYISSLGRIGRCTRNATTKDVGIGTDVGAQDGGRLM